MKVTLLIMFFVITGWCNHAYSQNFAWAKRLGGLVLKKDDGTTTKKFIKQ